MSILLQELVKRYGHHSVVDHVSLEIYDGEFFVLLGASGSGKSTILRMIAGLVPVDQGLIKLHGKDVTHLPPQQRNTGFVFQNYALFQHMTAAENIEFGLEVRHVPKAQRAARREELLDLVGLGGLGGRYPRQLSGGQQQRVAVARALAFDPTVLLLDEPFGALDAKIRVQLRQTLKTIQHRLGITTILVTHDQEEAFELADRIGVVERGKLLEVGTPTDLYRRPRHEFVANFLGSANLLAGKVQGDHVQLGSLALPIPPSNPLPTDSERPHDTAVLFRPEDLVVAAQQDELPGLVLGQGVVEEILFLGTLRRLLVRLQPLPGTWPLAAAYGESGIPLQVALLSESERTSGFQVGAVVWVGIREFYLMPRTTMHILFCIDNTTDHQEALRTGASLARSSGGMVTVLAVAPTPDEAERVLTTARAQLGQLPGLTLKTRCGRQTSDEILGEILEGSYDMALIVSAASQPAAAAKPRPPFASRSPDTIARVVEEASIPVLALQSARATMRRILLCTAGGEPGKLDVLVSSKLAQPAGATVTLLHVHTPNNAPQRAQSQPRAWIERHLQGGAQTLFNQGIRTDVKVRQGAIVEEILAEAREGDYDLIVIGGRLPESTPNSHHSDLTTNIVTHADRPVLVVRGLFDLPPVNQE